MSPPIWISHRGLKHAHSENTKMAFKEAIKAGFTHFETDLRITADEHIVLAHDDNLARLGGPKRPVATMSRAELEALPLPCGSRLMFFDELLGEFGDYYWTLDVKPETGLAVINSLARHWRTEHAQWFKTKVKFLMWSKAQQRLAESLFSDSHFYARRTQCWRAAGAVLSSLPKLGGIEPKRTYSLLPQFCGISLFEPRYVGAFHRQGAKALAFLPSNDKQAAAAVAAGFDEILTDHLILE